MIFSLKATEYYLFETVMNRVRTLQANISTKTMWCSVSNWLNSNTETGEINSEQILYYIIMCKVLLCVSLA